MMIQGKRETIENFFPKQVLFKNKILTIIFSNFFNFSLSTLSLFHSLPRYNEIFSSFSSQSSSLLSSSTSNTSPLIFVLSAGSDPMGNIMKFSEQTNTGVLKGCLFYVVILFLGCLWLLLLMLIVICESSSPFQQAQIRYTHHFLFSFFLFSLISSFFFFLLIIKQWHQFH